MNKKTALNKKEEGCDSHKSALKIIFVHIVPTVLALITIGITLYALTLPREILEKVFFIFYCVAILPTAILIIVFALKSKKTTLVHIILVNILAIFSFILSMGTAGWI